MIISSEMLLDYNFKAMGSPCQLKLYASKKTSLDLISYLVSREVERLEAKYSRYRNNSLLTEINSSAGTGKSILLDDETVALLNYAHQVFLESDGLFDITSGVLRKVWDFKSSTVPDTSLIEDCLRKIGWLKLERNDNKIQLPIKGMELDLGGIVKEYAVDRCIALLKQKGITSALVNLGGDVSVTGALPDGKGWNIGISHPEQATAAIANMPLASGAIASSGDYQRFLTYNNKRYCHILNPKTGYPVECGLRSVSVWASHCLLAGSLTTIAMLKGSHGLSWLQQLAVPFVCIDHENRLYGHN